MTHLPESFDHDTIELMAEALGEAGLSAAALAERCKDRPDGDCLVNRLIDAMQANEDFIDELIADSDAMAEALHAYYHYPRTHTDLS